MNKESFYAGLLMLLLPLLIVGLIVLASLDINWNAIGIFCIIGIYVITALFLIINGLNSSE